jgi:DNA-directed RNA polymerase specialized sigma24 family protein
MFYNQDRTYTEIAEALDVSLATVKRHLGAARLLLAARLRDLHKEDYVA